MFCEQSDLACIRKRHRLELPAAASSEEQTGPPRDHAGRTFSVRLDGDGDSEVEIRCLPSPVVAVRSASVAQWTHEATRASPVRRTP